MSGVVLRCRTCGTTQDHPGECDACSAGPVTWYCGNHIPGIWLDGPVCPACGSRFGDTAARPVAPPSSRAPSIPRSPTRPSTSGRPAPGPTRAPTPGLRRMPRPAAPPPPGTVADAGAETDPPSLSDLLVEMAEEGRRVRDTAVDTSDALPSAPRMHVPIVGCLFRLLLLLLFLGVLAVLALFMLFNDAF